MDADEPRAEDEQAVLDLLIPRAQARLDSQLRDSDALDTKALGVLAADATALGVVIAVRDDLRSVWWIAAIILGVASIPLLAIVWPRTYDIGPDPRDFYEAMGRTPRLDASRQMLAELVAAIEANDRLMPSETRLFKVGFAALVAGLIASLIIGLSS